MSEIVLIKKVKSGDMSAFDEIIKLYYPNILRYCLWHTGNRQNAEDATQETFLKAIIYMDRYVNKGQFKSFLYKIANNICIDMWRKKQNELLPETISYIERGFEEIESNISLYNTLDILPYKQQNIIILRYVHDLKIREIANILDEPMRTVQSRLRSVLKKIEENLGKEI